MVRGYQGDNETLITEWTQEEVWGNYTGAGFPLHEVLWLRKFVFDPSKIHLAQWVKSASARGPAGHPPPHRRANLALAHL